MNYDFQDITGVVRKLELQVAQAAEQISDLQSQTSNLANLQSDGSSFPAPAIINRLRNTDHNHSVNTWHEVTPSADNKKDKECANVYTHVSDTAVIVTDGAISATTNALQCATSSPFVSGDAGKRIIVVGAGTSGADLVTTIATFVDSSNVTLTDNAGTTVTNARVRFRLQKLARTNTKNSGSSTNEALKDAAHTNYATNINDPDWDKTSGVVRLGTTNTVDYFFGFYDTSTGAVFTPQNPLFPGRILYVIVNIARASVYVKIKGHLYVGIWNNEDGGLEFLKGGGFQLTGSVQNIPAVTATTQYMIVAETDRGYQYISEILTVANAPSLSSYIPNVVEVLLSWDSIPGGGDLKYTVYRKIGSGNVFNIAQIPNGSSRFVDNNPADRVDTGSASFPVISGFSNSLAFVATRTNELKNVPVGSWLFRQFDVPIVRSTNLSGVSELCLRIGLTEPLATEVRDGVANNTDTMTSAAGVFSLANHDGKTATVTDPTDSTRVISTTVIDVPDANTLQFADTIPWTSSGNVIEIEDSYPLGLILDLTGASLTQGIWSPHSEDDSRPQNVASNPNGSIYGDIGGIGDTGGSSSCPEVDQLVLVADNDLVINTKRAGDLMLSDLVYNPFTGEKCRIKSLVPAQEQTLKIITENGAESISSRTHRIILSADDNYGTKAENLLPGDTIATFDVETGVTELSRIVSIGSPGKRSVVRIHLAEGHIYAAGTTGKSVIAHNKPIFDIGPVF